MPAYANHYSYMLPLPPFSMSFQSYQQRPRWGVILVLNVVVGLVFGLIVEAVCFGFTLGFTFDFTLYFTYICLVSFWRSVFMTQVDCCSAWLLQSSINSESILSTGSQVSSSGPYPFHLTWYSILPFLVILWPRSYRTLQRSSSWNSGSGLGQVSFCDRNFLLSFS